MARLGEWEQVGIKVVSIGSKYRVVVQSILDVLGYGSSGSTPGKLRTRLSWSRHQRMPREVRSKGHPDRLPPGESDEPGHLRQEFSVEPSGQRPADGHAWHWRTGTRTSHSVGGRQAYQYPGNTRAIRPWPDSTRPARDTCCSPRHRVVPGGRTRSNRTCCQAAGQRPSSRPTPWVMRSRQARPGTLQD